MFAFAQVLGVIAEGDSAQEALLSGLYKSTQCFVCAGTFGAHMLSLPSPSNALYAGMDGLFTSRGGLNLDLPTPDSSNLLHMEPLGQWPSPSPR